MITRAKAKKTAVDMIRFHGSPSRAEIAANNQIEKLRRNLSFIPPEMRRLEQAEISAWVSVLEEITLISVTALERGMTPAQRKRIDADASRLWKQYQSEVAKKRRK